MGTPSRCRPTVQRTSRPCWAWSSWWPKQVCRSSWTPGPWSWLGGFWDGFVHKGRWSAFEVMISTEVHILNSKSIHDYVYIYIIYICIHIYIYISKVDTYGVIEWGWALNMHVDSWIFIGVFLPILRWHPSRSDWMTSPWPAWPAGSWRLRVGRVPSNKLTTLLEVLKGNNILKWAESFHCYVWLLEFKPEDKCLQ